MAEALETGIGGAMCCVDGLGGSGVLRFFGLPLLGLGLEEVKLSTKEASKAVDWEGKLLLYVIKGEWSDRGGVIG